MLEEFVQADEILVKSPKNEMKTVKSVYCVVYSAGYELASLCKTLVHSNFINYQNFSKIYMRRTLSRNLFFIPSNYND